MEEAHIFGLNRKRWMDGQTDGRTDRQTDGRRRTTDRRITTNEDGKRGERSRRGESENGVILVAQSVSHSVPSHLSERGPLSGDCGERFRHLRPAGLALKRLNYAVPPPHSGSGHQVDMAGKVDGKIATLFSRSMVIPHTDNY